MCLFCAAIPATLAVGANVHARQQRQQRLAEAQELQTDEKVSQPRIPAAAATTLVVVGLVTASVIYHTQLGG